MSDTITPRLRIKAQPEIAVRAKPVPPPKVRLRVTPALLPMEIELRNTGTMVQWRYRGEDWQDLIAIDDLDTTVSVGSVATLPAGAPASVVNVGTDKDMVLNFGIPQGIQGIQGEAATIAVGTVTTVGPATPAAVANVGTPNDAVFNFAIPQGAAATLAVGTVTTLTPGSAATVTNVGTSGAAVLNFGLPRGAPGLVTSVVAGANVAVDSTDPANPIVTAAGNVSGPASAVDNRVALFSGATGKLIKDSGVILGDSAARNVGTTAGTIAAGDDGRFGTVPNDYVTNARLANMANATVKGRNTAGTGDPEDITMAQLKALLALAQADITGLTIGSSPQFAEINLGHANDTTVTRSAAGRLAVEGADLLLSSVEDQTVSGGARVTVKNLGNLSGSTITPDPGDRPIQKITNNGAGSILPGANEGQYTLQIINTTGAGSITTTGWTLTGDGFDTTVTSKFLCSCLVTSDLKVMTVVKVA